MRRRLLLGEGAKEYVFSAQTTSRSVGSASGSTSININSTVNGTNIPYVVYSYSGCVTAVTTAATSVTIRYSENPAASARSGSVVLKQSESDNTLTITITQSGKPISFNNPSYVVIDGANGSTGYTTLNVTDSGTVTSKPSWANVTYSNGRINITATSANSSSTYRGSGATITIGEQRVDVYIIQMPNSYSTIDGHPYVTYNGMKWAIKNVGASSPSDYGNKYQWGATTTSGSYYTGSTNIKGTQYDTAKAVMGGNWRMADSNELSFSDNLHCFIYDAIYNGVLGVIAIGCGNDNILFFPFEYYDSGSYWTSKPCTNEEARCTIFSRNYGEAFYCNSRGKSMAIRGVHD